jgi:hypothetical protein
MFTGYGSTLKKFENRIFSEVSTDMLYIPVLEEHSNITALNMKQRVLER